MIVQILILAILLLAVPVSVGSLAVCADAEDTGGTAGLLFRWVSGQLILWAGLQFICVPLILAGRRFGDAVMLFSVYTAVMFLLALVSEVRRRAKKKTFPPTAVTAGGGKDRAAALLWLGAAVLLVLQLVLACVLAYEEGDDAYYVAVAAVTEKSDTMYAVLPYTGGSTGIDMRHGLAPFPVWVAYLSRLSGMRAVTVAHVALPVVLITMSYGIYYLIGRRLFVDDKRKQAFFLLLVEVLILFGGYSLYTPENFLLVRTAQGKAVLANIVLPFLLWLLLTVTEKIQADEKIHVCLWLLMASAVIAGCLCSTQGAFLLCMLLAAAGSCTALCYRKWRLLLPLLGCCILPVCMILLYYLL